MSVHIVDIILLQRSHRNVSEETFKSQNWPECPARDDHVEGREILIDRTFCLTTINMKASCRYIGILKTGRAYNHRPSILAKDKATVWRAIFYKEIYFRPTNIIQSPGQPCATACPNALTWMHVSINIVALRNGTIQTHRYYSSWCPLRAGDMRTDISELTVSLLCESITKHSAKAAAISLNASWELLKVEISQL